MDATPILPVINTKHGIPQSNGEKLMRLCRRVETIEGV